MQTKTYTSPRRKPRRRQRGTTGLPFYACRTAAMPASSLEMPFRRVRAVSRWGTDRWHAYEGSRGVMSRAAEDGRALLEGAQQIHAERHGGTDVPTRSTAPLLEAAKRTVSIGPSALPRRHKRSGVRGRNRVGQEARYARGMSSTTLITRRASLEMCEHPLEARLPVV